MRRNNFMSRSVRQGESNTQQNIVDTRTFSTSYFSDLGTRSQNKIASNMCRRHHIVLYQQWYSSGSFWSPVAYFQTQCLHFWTCFWQHGRINEHVPPRIVDTYHSYRDLYENWHTACPGLHPTERSGTIGMYVQDLVTKFFVTKNFLLFMANDSLWQRS